MNEKEIRQVSLMLSGMEPIPSGDWFMFSCPFRGVRHGKKTDRKPSFGISAGATSSYNCFACGVHGLLSKLPTDLAFTTGRDYPELRELISKGELFNQGGDYDMPERLTELPEISSQIYDMGFPFAKPWNFITAEDIVNWNIRHDLKEKRILFPVYDTNYRLVGIHGRLLNVVTEWDKEHQYKSYTHLSPAKKDPKSVGIFFGMQYLVVKDKFLCLVEGERDAILLRRFCTNVWATMGAGISSAQLETLTHVTNKLLLFFDNDTSGKQCRDKVIKKCKGLTDIYTIKNYFGKKDPAEGVEKKVVRKMLNSMVKV